MRFDELLDLGLFGRESVLANFRADLLSLVVAMRFSLSTSSSLFFDELRLIDELLALSIEEFKEFSSKSDDC